MFTHIGEWTQNLLPFHPPQAFFLQIHEPGVPTTSNLLFGARYSPLPGSPVQVIGPVACNDSHRHIEDLVVWELREKECSALALFSLQTGIPHLGKSLEGEGDSREKAEGFPVLAPPHTQLNSISRPLLTWSAPSLQPGSPIFQSPV